MLNKTTFVCIDCETTGLDPSKDKIIEIAAVKFMLSEKLDTFESLVDPQCEISQESLNIHGINQTMLEGKPLIKTILPLLLQFVGKLPIIGHSIGFDMEMLKQAAMVEGTSFPLERNYTIDTLRLARLYGDSPNNSLQQLAKHFNITNDLAHRALADVEMNCAVFKCLTTKFKTLKQLKEILSKPIKIKYMPLGKYKGRLFSDIPVNYLRWAASMDFDKDFLFSIRSELKKRKLSTPFSQAANPFLNL